jgi:hypothetical protein
MSGWFPLAGFTRAVLFVGFLASGTLCARASELKLEAMLIWGTDEAKSPKKEHVPVDDATAAKLRKVFKWKNYFIVNRQKKIVPSRGSNQFKLSNECTIEITELEGPRVEVKLIGKGVPVHKAVKELQKGEWFIYSGDDKHENAWFIIIKDLAEK